MEDLLKKYEQAVLDYKNDRHSESLAQFLDPYAVVKGDSNGGVYPKSAMLVGMACAMRGLQCYEELKGYGESVSGTAAQSLISTAVDNLKRSARIFYYLGAEMHAGFVLPLCGSLMAESNPAAGLRTIYDGIYRLENGGAPLKSLAIKESLKTISKRIITYLRFIKETDHSTFGRFENSIQVSYALGECLLLEGHREDALPFLVEAYDFYKNKVDSYTNAPESTHTIKMRDINLNFLKWSIANASEDDKTAAECIEYANSYGDWLAWYPGKLTKFPRAPHCEIDLREYPPFEFMSNLYIPFNSLYDATTYGRVGTEILGSYGQGIPAEELGKAKAFLEASVEVYKKHDDYHSAALTTVCLIEALIRENSDDPNLNLNDHVNFSLAYLDKERDSRMLQYLKAMVVPSTLVSEEEI